MCLFTGLVDKDCVHRAVKVVVKVGCEQSTSGELDSIGYTPCFGMSFADTFDHRVTEGKPGTSTTIMLLRRNLSRQRLYELMRCLNAAHP